jgi:hypothetical protein
LGKGSGKYDRWEKVSLGKGKILKNKILVNVIIKMTPFKRSNREKNREKLEMTSWENDN